MELSWSLDLAGQLLGPLAGAVLDAHAHQLAELIEPFVGKGAAGEVALPCRATNRYERRFNGALKLAINDGYAFVKGHPIWSAGATTLLCDDKTGTAMASRSPAASRNRRASMRRSFKTQPAGRLFGFSMRETIGKLSARRTVDINESN
jgi:hypothetical protein